VGRRMSSKGNGPKSNKPVTNVSTNLCRPFNLLKRNQIRFLTFGLLHCSGRVVAGLGDNLILNRLALLIRNAKRLVGGGVYQFYLDLAELANEYWLRRDCEIF
jgi:hypothetical protein